MKALERMGTDVRRVVQIPRILQDIGFANVQHITQKWTFGPWVQEDGRQKEISRLFAPNMLEGILPNSLRVIQKALNMSQADADDLMSALRREVLEGKM